MIISLIASVYFLATAENCNVYNGSCPGEETKTTIGFYLLVFSVICMFAILAQMLVMTLRRLRDPKYKIKLP